MCYITSYDSVLKYGEILGVSRLAGFHENISLLFVKSKEISLNFLQSRSSTTRAYHYTRASYFIGSDIIIPL